MFAAAVQGLITQPSDKAAPLLNARVVSLASAMDLGLCTLATLGFPGGGGEQPSHWAGCRTVRPVYLGMGLRKRD